MVYPDDLLNAFGSGNNGWLRAEVDGGFGWAFCGLFCRLLGFFLGAQFSGRLSERLALGHGMGLDGFSGELGSFLFFGGLGFGLGSSELGSFPLRFFSCLGFSKGFGFGDLG